jgi:hypothetical protein
MKQYIARIGNEIITLDAILNEIENASTVQPSAECSAPTPAMTSTSSDICTTYRNTNNCNYTPYTMKVLIFFTTLSRIAKYGQVMNPTLCVDPVLSGLADDSEWYDYFFEGKAMPPRLGSGIVTVEMKDFIKALQTWVGTEKSQFP